MLKAKTPDDLRNDFTKDLVIRQSLIDEYQNKEKAAKRKADEAEILKGFVTE